MTDRRDPPPSLDEDDDEEETLVDVPSRPLEESDPEPAISLEPPPERPLPRSLVDDDDDDEATELLIPGQGATGAGSEIHAARGALRLEAARARDDDEEEDATERLPSPSALRGGFRDSLDDAPPIRSLDSLPHIALGDDVDDRTLSRPKLVRMTFRPEEGEATAVPPPEADFRPTDNALRGRSLLRSEPDAVDDDAHDLPDETPAPLPDAEPGTLVIEVPAEAVVFVDGAERARGAVRLEGVDRYARFAVRVHCPGFEPWSGLVSLNGKSAAKVKPTLRRR